jgi:hypothetical protein
MTATRIRSLMVSIMTTFGDILLRGELLAGGRYELRSYQENVTVRARSAFIIDATSREGCLAPEVELDDARRSEAGRLDGSYGRAEQPAALVLSSTDGRVLFGLASEQATFPPSGV